jgi:hypothetical protein
MRKALLLVMMLFIASCSGDRPAGDTGGGSGEAPAASAPEPAAVTQQAGDEGGDRSLRIVPGAATRTTALELKSAGFNLEDARVVWLLNGSPASTISLYRFDTRELGARKGDSVQATAEVEGAKYPSNTVVIRNAPPELTLVRIVYKGFKQGDAVGLEVEAADPDGDPVTLGYQWTLNGKPAGTGECLDAGLKRGDSLGVAGTPFDGEEYGERHIISRTVGNVPPEVTQHNEHSFDGKLYTYAVKAEDPDGDTLSYSLDSGPQGMSIDPGTGLVKWEVPADFLGAVDFRVSVSDGNGGRAELPVGFTLSGDKKEEEKKK